MGETPKRLKPKLEVVRALFARSGNQCYFPDCVKVIIDDDAELVGQVCHIRGVEPGSARFDSEMTNEQRRSIQNLMLMCYEHHIKVDDRDRKSDYTEAVLEAMKEEHEARYLAALRRLQDDDIVDEKQLSTPRYAKTLDKYFAFTGETCDGDEVQASVEELGKLVDRIHSLPKTARQLLAIIIDRGTETSGSSQLELEVPAQEVREAARLTDAEFRLHLGTLSHNNFTELGQQTWEDVPFVRVFRAVDWFLWPEFKRFCSTNGIEVRHIIVDLGFSLLD